MMRLEVVIIFGFQLAVVSLQRTLNAASHYNTLDHMQTAVGDDIGNTIDTSELIPRTDMTSKHEQPEICDRAISVRKGIRPSGGNWPNGVVPFEFHESIENDVTSRDKMNTIFAAINHWSTHTCISFRRRQPTDRSFLIFRSDRDECSSNVGIFSWNFTGQNISLGNECWSNESIAVHEIGHAIGFHHEHQRKDRDEHVEIIWQNIEANETYNFCKEDDFNRGLPYDLTSNMQYPQWILSSDEYNKSTIVTKDHFQQWLLYKHNLLSFRDRLLANLMYGCIDETSDACKNGGYLRRTTLGEYSCDCPPNTRGEFCEDQFRESYYGELPCGGNVTREGVIETPGYPGRSQDDISCTWQVIAPDGHRVQLTIVGFKFSPRMRTTNPKQNNKCVDEGVEFRLNTSDRNDGSFYCGTDLKPGKVLLSNGSWAAIFIRANDKRSVTSGLRVMVNFVPIIGLIE